MQDAPIAHPQHIDTFVIDVYMHLALLARTVLPAGLLAACLPAEGPVRLGHTLLLNFSYPAPWLNWYLAVHADEIDPVFQQAWRTALSFVWPEGLTPPAPSALLDLAQQYQLCAGAIGAARDTDSQWLMIVAVAGPRALPYAEWLPACSTAAHALLPICRRLAAAQAERWPWTEQETQLLRAWQYGWTAHDIQRLLHLSARSFRRLLHDLRTRTGWCLERSIRYLNTWQPLSLWPQEHDAALDRLPLPFWHQSQKKARSRTVVRSLRAAATDRPRRSPRLVTLQKELWTTALPPPQPEKPADGAALSTTPR